MKKITAREILILLCAIGIGILCFLGTFGYNYYKDSQIKNLYDQKNNVQKQSDRLNYIFDYKERNHLWYFETMSREMHFDLSDKLLNNQENLWNYTIKTKVFGKIDSVNKRWNGKWKKSGLTDHFKNIGFATPQRLNNFIVEKSMTTEDSLNHKKAIQILKGLVKIDEQSANLNYSKLDSVEQKQFGMQCFAFACILLFGLRYLYYLIKWCIVTLKNN